MTTAAETFRVIDTQVALAQELLDKQVVKGDTRRMVCAYLTAVHLAARDGLREALANQPKLAACPVLFCACTKLLAEYDGCSGPSEFGDRAVAEKLIEGIRDAVAKALEPNTGEPT